MKMVSKEGLTMCDVSAVGVEGDNIYMNCRLMGAYSMKLYLTPQELRTALKLVDWDLISFLPGMLINGTKGEEKIARVAKELVNMVATDAKLILGPKGEERMGSVAKEVGLNTAESLVNSLLLLLQVVLEEK